MSLFDRIENRLRRWAIPGLLKIVAVYQLLVWVLWLLNPDRNEFFALLSLDPEALKRGQIRRLITFAFIPQTTSAIFILFVTWFLIWIGASLESAWGAFKAP